MHIPVAVKAAVLAAVAGGSLAACGGHRQPSPPQPSQPAWAQAEPAPSPDPPVTFGCVIAGGYFTVTASTGSAPATVAFITVEFDASSGQQSGRIHDMRFMHSVAAHSSAVVSVPSGQYAVPLGSATCQVSGWKITA